MRLFLAMAILAVVLVASGAALIIIDNSPQPTDVPNATPTVAPTVNPTPDGRVLTVDEFVSNALAGKYKRGQIVIISGTLESVGLYIVELGPPYKGFTVSVEARRENNGGLYPPMQAKMTVRGKYTGNYTSIIALEDGVLVK